MFDSYYENARRRFKRRKSPWNLILIPLGIFGIGASWFFLSKLFLSIQARAIPSDALLSSYTRIGSIFIFIPIMFPSIGLGMILADLAACVIPAARKTFEREAEGYEHVSFKESMKELSIFTFCALVITIPLCLIGTHNYFYVMKDGVYYSPFFSFSTKQYHWDDIEEIQTRCLAERDNLHLNYKLIMADGTKVDLLEEPRLKFLNVYPQIKVNLHANSSIRYKIEITDSGLRRLRKRYSPQNAEQILAILKEKPLQNHE